MIIVSESIFSNLWQHAVLLASGGGLVTFISYAVDTYPTAGLSPKQLWFLGMIKYATGHARSGGEVIQTAKSLSATQQLASAKADVVVAKENVVIAQTVKDKING